LGLVSRGEKYGIRRQIQPWGELSDKFGYAAGGILFFISSDIRASKFFLIVELLGEICSIPLFLRPSDRSPELHLLHLF